jgi:hypothetical protein
MTMGKAARAATVALSASLGALAACGVILSSVLVPSRPSYALASGASLPASAGRPDLPGLIANGPVTQYTYLPIVMRCYTLCGGCVSDGQGGTEVITTTSSSCLAHSIRIDLYERGTGYGFSLREVEAYGPGDPTWQDNLLAGGTACASSIEGNNPIWGPDKAIDGLMSTRWSSDWDEPQWIVVDLPDPAVVKWIVLHWETAYAADYQVVVSSVTACQ